LDELTLDTKTQPTTHTRAHTHAHTLAQPQQNTHFANFEKQQTQCAVVALDCKNIAGQDNRAPGTR